MDSHHPLTSRVRRGSPSRRVSGFVGMAALFAASVRAQTWTGGAGSGSWAEDANWSGSAPVSSPTTDLTFAGSTQTTTQNDIANPFALRHLTFAPGASAFWLGGYALQLHGNVVNNSAALQTVGNHVTLGANSQWSAAAGNIRFTGNLGPTNVYTLSKAGAGTLELTGNNDIRIADKGIAGGGTVLVSGGTTTNGGVGNLFAATGGANTLVVTNGAGFVTSANMTVGDGSNVVVVAGEGSTLSGIGNPYLYLNNDTRLIVADGATVTNMGRLRLGDSGKARMSVVVTNGAHLGVTELDYRGTRLFSVFVGGAGTTGQPSRLTLTTAGINAINYNAVSNTITIAQDGILTVAGGINLGYAYSGNGEDNRLIVTNGGRVVFGNTTYIGYNFASNNTAWVGGLHPVSGAPSVMDCNGKKLGIGHGTAKRNAVIVDEGGVITNATSTIVGDDYTSAGNNYALESSLIVTNGGCLYGTVTVGGRSLGNRFVIAGSNSLYNAGGATLSIGAAANNSLVLDGGMATNINQVRIGYVQAQANYGIGNTALIANGGRLYSTGIGHVGNTESYINKVASHNRATVSGAGSLWDLAGATLRVGYANFNADFLTNNALRVEAAGAVTNVGAATVGYAVAGATSVSNRLELAGGSFSATSLRIYPNNVLAAEIGPDGIVAATVSATATFDAGSLLMPTAQVGAQAGTYKVLGAGTLVDNGLALDPFLTDASLWRFHVEGHALYVTYSRPGSVVLVR